ncbi:error-prone DNA polymerase [Stutzerimonas nitrititolerans]|uniref:error-prone DNA polymerase n=1 Tax=Stutzerimonas nitrititolerans TaxID=2482751 RepID=UPI0028B05C6C|nr:error-prone DNA polymerase [Stutzerimonas nitrititolerans]
MTGYAELHCLSNFSFQRGASSAKELFERAARLGYRALAITDECTLAGTVRAWQASKDAGMPLIVGSEMRVEDGPKLVLLAEARTGYQALSQLITLARRRTDKGCYRLLVEDFPASTEGLLAIWLADDDAQHAPWLQKLFAGRLWLGIELHRGTDDAGKLRKQLQLAQACDLPALACGGVHMHARGRRALQDCMTAIRHHLPVAEAGAYLFPNGERHLRRHEELAELYPPRLLAETLRIAERCTFDLGQLRYQYPHEVVPAGHSATSWLRRLVEDGARWRWPDGVPVSARSLIEHELSLIAELQYESYFLTVHDIVRWAREQHILCQGRGSAANSTVCFALSITELDPTRTGTRMLFERFLSRERNEPPDIDVDFEHERREEVIQYIFRRYGRERAALTAVVCSYHAAGAVRDVAKALGLPPDQVTALADCCGRWSDKPPSAERLAEAGFDPNNPLLRRVLVLTGELIGFPRHLSQHPGGFVISEQPLSMLVPVENAAMAGRTVIQWDKDDLDLLGLMKVDVLSLGMLSALHRCFDLIERYRGTRWTLASLPAEDPATYAMISRADTIGVFQIESRAQMVMLPRLRPKTFYDLVIQVAIIRPGPIQGDMVHPYLRRRNGTEPVNYPSEELVPVFERTLGVPLFQEQVMELAIIAAEYTPGEADELRRSMAAWKRHGGLEHHRQRLTTRMLEKGYEPAFIERIFEQIKGFGSYGFPESHAASFALLTYASSWLKCHEPAAFACALINSWPMGFYSPDQVLQDVRRHDIEVRPVDVRYSDWDCSLEPGGAVQPAIRMGLRMIRGMREGDARRIETARRQRTFVHVEDLILRAELDARARERLADAGALQGLAGNRHQARWTVAGIEPQLPMFAGQAPIQEAPPALPAPSFGEELHTDYATLGTTLGPHPLTLLREQLSTLRCRSSRQLLHIEPDRLVSVAGLVVGRQRPQTASGVTFVTLEDEFGMINVVVWRDVAERQRQVFLQSQLLRIDGHLEIADGIRHVIAGRLTDLSALLAGLDVRSRDFQ